MIRAVCLDFGNVLAKFDHKRAVRRLARYSSLEPDALFEAVYNAALEHDYEAGRLTTAEFVAEAKAVGALSCSDQDFLSAYADIFTPIPASLAVVPLLKPHYRLVLASNTNSAHAQQFQRQFAETLAHFDAQVLSYEVGVRKPRLPYFAHLARAAGCEPGECLFVDDLEGNTVGARAAGMRGVPFIGYADLRELLTEAGVLPAG